MEHVLLSLAAERAGALRADAARHALARLATCCRPATWRRWASAVRSRAVPTACCA